MTGTEELRSGPFVHSWRATAVSGLGSYVTVFALQALVVLTLDGTAGDVGWLNAAVLLLGISVMWWLDVLSLPALMVVVSVLGTAAVVNMAATMSFVPRLVSGRSLQPAHARVDGADAVSSTAGPALGGVLVSAVGAPLAVLVDAATYAFSAVTLRRIAVDEPPPPMGVTARGIVADVAEGVRWAYGRSGLRTLAIATHGWFVGNAAVGVVLAPYALLTLDLSAFQFGLVGAAGGGGALVGATVTTRVGRWLGTGRTILVCHVITTMAVVVVVAPVAGLLADTYGIRPVLAAAAGTFAVVALGLGLTSFRTVRAPVLVDD